jgi:hypothetical protein
MIQTKQTEKGQEILRVLFNVYYNKTFYDEFLKKDK